VVPIGGGTGRGGLSPLAVAVEMAAPFGCGGSDPPAAGARVGPKLSSGAHATICIGGASGPEVASAGAEGRARAEAIEATAGTDTAPSGYPLCVSGRGYG